LALGVPGFVVGVFVGRSLASAVFVCGWGSLPCPPSLAPFLVMNGLAESRLARFELRYFVALLLDSRVLGVWHFVTRRNHKNDAAYMIWHCDSHATSSDDACYSGTFL
jgi:hypothetical protein